MTSDFQVCIIVTLSQKTIRATIEAESKAYLSNEHQRIACKPIWENGDFGIGLNRREAGPWQTRLTLPDKKAILVLVQFESYFIINS